VLIQQVVDVDEQVDVQVELEVVHVVTGIISEAPTLPKSRREAEVYSVPPR